MTEQLVDELVEEVGRLLERVEAQIQKPDVQPVGLIHQRTLGVAVETDVAVGLRVIRKRDDPSA